jgi:hypothetical protein
MTIEPTNERIGKGIRVKGGKEKSYESDKRKEERGRGMKTTKDIIPR